MDGKWSRESDDRFIRNLTASSHSQGAVIFYCQKKILIAAARVCEKKKSPRKRQSGGQMWADNEATGQRKCGSRRYLHPPCQSLRDGTFPVYPHSPTGPSGSAFLSVAVEFQLTFCANSGALHSFSSQPLEYYITILQPGLLLSAFAFDPGFNPFFGGKMRRGGGLLFWKLWISQNKRPFGVLALLCICAGFTKSLHPWFWQGKRRLSGRGFSSSLFSAVFFFFFFPCVCVNGKQPPRHTGHPTSLAPNWRPDGSI